MSISSDVTTTIIETVADKENTHAEVLPPLAETLEEETFERLASRELEEPLRLEYLWYEVTVLPDGEVVVTP